MTDWGELFNYKGYFNCPSSCYLLFNGNAVMATETPNNKGTSITNMSEGIATLVCSQYHINPSELVFIEHYARDAQQLRAGIKESFDVVEYTWTESVASNPRWHPITENNAMALMGIEE